jgi:hypothetical protein
MRTQDASGSPNLTPRTPDTDQPNRREAATVLRCKPDAENGSYRISVHRLGDLYREWNGHMWLTLVTRTTPHHVLSTY